MSYVTFEGFRHRYTGLRENHRSLHMPPLKNRLSLLLLHSKPPQIWWQKTILCPWLLGSGIWTGPGKDILSLCSLIFGTSAGNAGPVEAGGPTLEMAASLSCLAPLGRSGWRAGLRGGCSQEAMASSAGLKVVDFSHGGSVFQQIKHKWHSLLWHSFGNYMVSYWPLVEAVTSLPTFQTGDVDLTS